MEIIFQQVQWEMLDFHLRIEQVLLWLRIIQETEKESSPRELVYTEKMLRNIFEEEDNEIDEDDIITHLVEADMLKPRKFGLE